MPGDNVGPNDQGSESNDDEGSQESDAALVFQCAQCHSIVGDSSTWTCANEILRTISLKCKIYPKHMPIISPVQNVPKVFNKGVGSQFLYNQDYRILRICQNFLNKK